MDIKYATLSTPADSPASKVYSFSFYVDDTKQPRNITLCWPAFGASEATLQVLTEGQAFEGTVEIAGEVADVVADLVIGSYKHERQLETICAEAAHELAEALGDSMPTKKLNAPYYLGSEVSWPLRDCRDDNGLGGLINGKGVTISIDDFISGIGKAGLYALERTLGYDQTLALKDDWHVTAEKGQWHGNTVYLLSHSNLLYVFGDNKAFDMFCNLPT